MIDRTKRTLGACAAAGLALAGCAGAPTRIHTLDAVAPAARQSAVVPAFRVDAVHIPPAFDRPELIRRTGPYTVTLSDTDRWAAPLGDLIRRTLTQDLAERLPDGVVIFPDAPKPPEAGGLVIDILQISPSAQGVAMDVSWTWLAPRGALNAPQAATAPAQAPLIAHLSTPSVGESAASIAPEISALLAALADRIAMQPQR